jgi:sortase A
MVSFGATKIRVIERVFLAIGLALLTLWGVARVHRSMASRSAVERFKADAAESAGKRALNSEALNSGSGVVFRQWSPQRIAAYKDSLAAKLELPLAILRIPKINLEVPVFNDTDELTLNRGVGRIVGTAQTGELGNVGIAGHRDGFFRGLKDVGRGDFIELILPRGTDQYVVTEIQIVDPEDVHVLDPTLLPTLTLVTCYPFYYLGSAPQRYVVTASLQISSHSDLSVETYSISSGKKINK